MDALTSRALEYCLTVVQLPTHPDNAPSTKKKRYSKRLINKVSVELKRREEPTFSHQELRFGPFSVTDAIIIHIWTPLVMKLSSCPLRLGSEHKRVMVSSY